MRKNAAACIEPRAPRQILRRTAIESNEREDIRGASRLTLDAIKGVTDLVEAVHLNILRKSPGRPLAGVTSMVYRAVRGVTELAGGGLDAALRKVAQSELGAGTWQGREPLVAALNGVLGDHLEQSGNSLATPMSLRLVGGAPLVQPIAGATGRILVLVHGLCMNDLQWQTEGGGHGALLAQMRGYTPVYLRYNTGRHISDNGEEFAAQLEALVAAWPVEIESLAIIGHSMGGLVARGACWHGEKADHTWRGKLHRLATLGSPHHGAPLERAGNWLTLATGISSYSRPFARLAKIRSLGITDLRYGSILREDWQGIDRFAVGDARRVVPLPEGVECYALAGTVGSQDSGPAAGLAGDGLVLQRSALGLHDEPSRCLHFKASATLPKTNHFALLASEEAARHLLAWF